MNRAWYCLFPLLSLVSGCVDPTAVQNFAQSAPPAAQFHALILDYPGIIAQEPVVYAIVSKQPASSQPPVEATTFCSYVPTLDKMHSALIAYMTALGAAATAGGANSEGSPAGKLPASPDETQPCPPEVMPVVAAVIAVPASSREAATEQPPTTTLGSDLQNFAKAVPKLGISPADATAAATLMMFFEDVTTAALREEAVHDALLKGHDGFLATVSIEETIIGYVAQDARDYQASTTARAAGVLRGLSDGNVAVQAMALRFSLAFNIGQLMTPQQAGAVVGSAQLYLQALGKLKSAYLTLYEASVSGQGVLTAHSWKTIQPLIADVQNSYAALIKL